MSTIAIGDIHGNSRALDDLLSRIAPDVGIKDTIVFLGDYIDRGPETRQCIDRILDFRSTAKGRVVCLLGNHEQWLLRSYEDPARHSWLLGMEAFETVRSYSCAAALQLRRAAEQAGVRLVTGRVALPYGIFFEAVPKRHTDFLKSLQAYCRTPDAICVHGGLDPAGGPVESQPIDNLVWGAYGFPEQYDGPEFVVYGHTGNPVVDENGWPHPRTAGNACGVDTICKGVLTAFRLPERTVLQSNRFL